MNTVFTIYKTRKPRILLKLVSHFLSMDGRWQLIFLWLILLVHLDLSVEDVIRPLAKNQKKISGDQIKIEKRASVCFGLYISDSQCRNSPACIYDFECTLPADRCCISQNGSSCCANVGASISTSETSQYTTARQQETSTTWPTTTPPATRTTSRMTTVTPLPGKMCSGVDSGPFGEPCGNRLSCTRDYDCVGANQCCQMQNQQACCYGPITTPTTTVSSTPTTSSPTGSVCMGVDNGPFGEACGSRQSCRYDFDCSDGFAKCCQMRNRQSCCYRFPDPTTSSSTTTQSTTTATRTTTTTKPVHRHHHRHKGPCQQKVKSCGDSSDGKNCGDSSNEKDLFAAKVIQHATNLRGDHNIIINI